MKLTHMRHKTGVRGAGYCGIERAWSTMYAVDETSNAGVLKRWLYEYGDVCPECRKILAARLDPLVLLSLAEL